MASPSTPAEAPPGAPGGVLESENHEQELTTTTIPNASPSSPEVEPMANEAVSSGDGGWWGRHAMGIKVFFRVAFGFLWLAAGIFKFLPGFVDSFPGSVSDAAANAPPWLAGWYNFWVPVATDNASLIVYTVGTLELMIGLALIFGFARKIAYFGGMALALLIWAVPEAFGTPYSGDAGATDLGTGIAYAVMFLGLIALNAAFGPSRYSIDYYIEQKLPSWAKVAELRKTTPVNPKKTSTPSREGATA